MTSDQIGGLLRTFVPAIVAYAVGRGWIPAGAAGDIGTAVLALAAAGWSMYTNSKTKQIATVAAMPEVKKVVADASIANGPLADDKKVVTA